MHSFIVPAAPREFPPGIDTLHLSPDPGLGIEEVRQVITFLSKKPLLSPFNVVIIHQAEKLTLPAQHAILKTLEEPPGNSQIYLVTTEPESLLSTILSRVQVSQVSMYQSVDPASLKNSSEILQKLLSAKRVGEKLVIIDRAGFTRDTALEFLNHLELLMHQNLNLGLSYQLIVDTRKYLKANVNVRLALDSLALGL
jgi:DNA polymerase-3 subunit delta'